MAFSILGGREEKKDSQRGKDETEPEGIII